MVIHSGPAITWQTRPPSRARTWGWEKKFFFRNLEFSFKVEDKVVLPQYVRRMWNNFEPFLPQISAPHLPHPFPQCLSLSPPTGRFWRILDHGLFLSAPKSWAGGLCEQTKPGFQIHSSSVLKHCSKAIRHLVEFGNLQPASLEPIFVHPLPPPLLHLNIQLSPPQVKNTLFQNWSWNHSNILAAKHGATRLSKRIKTGSNELK